MTSTLIDFVTAASTGFPTPPPPSPPPFLAGFLQLALWVCLGASLVGFVIVGAYIAIGSRSGAAATASLARGWVWVGLLLVLGGGALGGLIAATSPA